MDRFCDLHTHSHFSDGTFSPTQLLEAAEIDGATKVQRSWYVSIPVLVPTIVTMLILHCGSLMSSSFDKVYLLQNDGIRSASETISTYVYRSGWRADNTALRQRSV